MNYESWTIGKIVASSNHDLDRRVEHLIQLREQMTKALQAELDFIYGTVEKRLAESR